jgi:isocitrate dehydrogenase
MLQAVNILRDAQSVKSPEKVNMHIFRENTEDIYAGFNICMEIKRQKSL